MNLSLNMRKKWDSNDERKKEKNSIFNEKKCHRQNKNLFCMIELSFKTVPTFFFLIDQMKQK